MNETLRFLVDNSTGGPIDDPELWAAVRPKDMLCLYQTARESIKIILDNVDRESAIYNLHAMRIMIALHRLGSVLLPRFYKSHYVCARCALLLYNDIRVLGDGNAGGST